MKAPDKNQLIFGRHPVVDAIRAGKDIDKVMLQKGTTGNVEKELRKLCKQHNIPLQYTPKERIARYAKGKNHQGVIAFLALIPYYKIADLLPLLFEQHYPPLLVVLDGVTDVRNFGAIARTAEGAGAHGIIVPSKGSALINADAMKTSAGALSHLPVCRETSISAAVDFLLLSGVQVVASELGAPNRLQDIDFTVPTAIVMGAEGEGINPGVLRKASKRFLIPMQGKTDSFNVSVAAGMILYESMCQRVS